jgi:hypothetical protein
MGAGSTLLDALAASGDRVGSLAGRSPTQALARSDVNASGAKRRSTGMEASMRIHRSRPNPSQPHAAKRPSRDHTALHARKTR